jgi:hypothetical protein
MHILERILARRVERRGGELDYFGLREWWLSAFSQAEREHIEAVFTTPDLPAGSKPLTRDRGLLAVQTAAGLLAVLADRLGERSQDRGLACRVLAKAEERALAEHDILGLHVAYHQMIRLHCRWKEYFADAMDLAFAACHKQMRLASKAVQAFREKCPEQPLPTHLGYLQAATILEQQGAYAQAIEICRQAEAEGWGGNWSWRIQRLARRLSSSVKPISSSGLGRI